MANLKMLITVHFQHLCLMFIMFIARFGFENCRGGGQIKIYALHTSENIDIFGQPLI